MVETVALDFERGTMAIAEPEEVENKFDPDVHVPVKVFHPLFVVVVEKVSEKELKALSLVVNTLLFADLFINPGGSLLNQKLDQIVLQFLDYI